MPADRSQGTPGSKVRRMLVIFYGVSALTLALLAAGAVIATQSVARSQALDEAERQTDRLARLVVSPLLPAVLDGTIQRDAELEMTIKNRMSDGNLLQITIWDDSGQVVYASDLNLIGQKQNPVPTEVVLAIEKGTSSADFTDEPEIKSPKVTSTADGFVEVYVPLNHGTQPRLAFEAYYDYSRVKDVASSLLSQILPLVLVPMVLLQLIQLPIGAALARRVRRHEADRSRLLEQTLSVSEKQRIRIAGDLHDGPIQDLAGIGYALGAIAPAVPEAQQPLMRDVQDSVHHAIESLRRLMIDLYPPDLTAGQLPATIAALAVPLRERGTHVDVRVEPMPALDSEHVTTLYRVARESLANVVQHAQADHVDIRLTLATLPSGVRAVTLQVADNGVGIDPTKLDRRSEGHLGIKLLVDRVEALGGSMTLAPGDDGGTNVTVILPVPSLNGAKTQHPASTAAPTSPSS